MDLQILFSFYNDKYFSGKLKTPEIRIEPVRVSLGTTINNIIILDSYAVKEEYQAIGKMILLHEMTHCSIGKVHHRQKHGRAFVRTCRRIDKMNNWPRVSRKQYEAWPFTSLCKTDADFKLKYSEYLGIKQQRDGAFYRRCLVDADIQSIQQLKTAVMQLTNTLSHGPFLCRRRRIKAEAFPVISKLFNIFRLWE